MDDGEERDTLFSAGYTSVRMPWACSRYGPLCSHRENCLKMEQRAAEPTKGSREESWWYHLNPHSNWVWSQLHCLDYLVTLANKFSILQVDLSWHLQLNEHHRYTSLLPIGLTCLKHQSEFTIVLSYWRNYLLNTTIYRLKEYINTLERFHGSLGLFDLISSYYEWKPR